MVEGQDADIEPRSNVQRTIEFDISGSNPDQQFILYDKPEQEQNETGRKKMAERVKRLRKSHEQVKEQLYGKAKDENAIENLENEPAYVRKKIKLEDTKHSSESKLSKYSLSEDEEKNSKLREDNPYLHDNVD